MERDATTSGKDYDHARFRSTYMGRFLGADILRGTTLLPGSLNRYSYVLNNPVKYVDPFGLTPVDCTYSADECPRYSASATVDAAYPTLDEMGITGFFDLLRGGAFMDSLGGGSDFTDPG